MEKPSAIPAVVSKARVFGQSGAQPDFRKTREKDKEIAP